MLSECGTDAYGQPTLVIARVRCAHGLKGEVKLQYYGARSADFTRYATVQLDDGRCLNIDRARRGRNDSEIIVLFREINQRQDAEALINQNLYLPVSALPALVKDEFYHHDLIGLKSLDNQGKFIGTVNAVYNFGAGDILAIALADNPKDEYLHPFKPEFVKNIDLEQKTCTLFHVTES